MEALQKGPLQGPTPLSDPDPIPVECTWPVADL